MSISFISKCIYMNVSVLIADFKSKASDGYCSKIGLSVVT